VNLKKGLKLGCLFVFDVFLSKKINSNKKDLEGLLLFIFF